MQKFRFRLDSALRLRTLRLSIEQDKLARALAEVARIEKAVADLSAERAAAKAFVQTAPETGVTELRSLAAYLLAYEARSLKLTTSLESARLRAGEQRQRVLTAEREERLLIKLKAKRRADWQIEADHEVETLAQELWNAVHFDRNSD
jgi:flagellar export protein FliJ